MSLLSSKLSVRDVSFKGARAFVRVDFNVPVADGVVQSTQRIEAAVPTIKYILDSGAQAVILASHLGRANGERSEKFSLKPVVPILSKLLNKNVTFLEDCVGPKIEKRCLEACNGEVILLENLRFHYEEEGSRKDSSGNKIKAKKEEVDAFCQSLSKLGTIYVNDAFGTSHRAHSSIVGVNTPQKVCGLLMLKELESFAKVLENPEKPVAAILGGSKVSDKILLINNLLPKINKCVIVGGMAYTFVKLLKNPKIGDSIFDSEGAKMVPEIIKKAEELNVEIVLPVDFVIADKFSADANTKICTIEEGIPDNWMGLDIGPATRDLLKSQIKTYKTIIWNGPAGVFEFDKFSGGTNELLKCVSDCTKSGSITVIGGGDTASAALNLMKTNDLQFVHISTGGGASLELLEGKELPGITSLSTK